MSQQPYKFYVCFSKILRLRILILFAIFLIAFFLRFYRFETVPPGLGRDEVSVAYNAYSILQTGRDEHGRFFPVYFEAIGDQKLPVIIYLSVSSVKLFGLTAFGTRFPFALLGSLTIVFLYLLLQKISFPYNNIVSPKLVFLSPLLLAVNPWQIAHSRAVYEICLGTFFFTAGAYCFLQGITSKKWFLVSIFVFALAFYTYSMTRLLSPLLFVYFCFIYRKEVANFSKSFQIFSLLWIGFLLIPFILTFFDPGGITAPAGAVIFSSSKVKSSILEFRSYVANTDAAFLSSLFFNRIIMMLYEYGKNILAALSPEFYFAKGSDMAGIGTNGQFYMIEVIPFLIGLIAVIKLAYAKNRFFQMILGWIVLTILTASFTISPPYATRTLFMVVPAIIITAFGWLQIISWVKTPKLINRLIIITVTLIYLWHITFYLISYYHRFPVVYAQNWEAKTKDLFDYLKEEEQSVDKIVITKPENSMYAFLLFYHQVPPEQVWTGLERHLRDPDGWTHGKKFGKYEFRAIDWTEEFSSQQNMILVSAGGEYPDKQVVTKEIFYPTKYNVFPYGQKVVAYPEKRVAYRIWKYKYDPNSGLFQLVQ